ncbi:MAG: sensor histidine kinase [Pseudomonadota bacterium]
MTATLSSPQLDPDLVAAFRHHVLLVAGCLCLIVFLVAMAACLHQQGSLNTATFCLGAGALVAAGVVLARSRDLPIVPCALILCSGSALAILGHSALTSTLTLFPVALPLLVVLALLTGGIRAGLITLAFSLVGLTILVLSQPDFSQPDFSQPVVTRSGDVMEISSPVRFYLAVGLLCVLLAWLTGSYLKWEQFLFSAIQQSSDAKSEFLSGMSHELRTPLNSIMGFADVLKRGYAGELSNKQSDYVANILASSGHMLALVNDLLDIARIEAGQMEFVPAPVKVSSVLKDCADMFAEEAQSKSVALCCEVAPPLKERLALLDELKFKQIVLNLLSNALKFSVAGGRIDLTGRIEDSHLVIVVTDNGKGIPRELDDKIFDRFFQANRSSDNKSPGTGLGLPISRHFAELHGGTIVLDRRTTASLTRFVVDLPFKPADNPG